ncbi:class I SAM-dependent methyltransferase, partial [Jeotgalibaca porci]
LVGQTGHIHGFDVQEEAIAITKEKCLQAGVLEQVSLHHIGHEQAHTFLEPDCELGAVIYNLGYLPGSDKRITTMRESTLTSIDTLLPRLRVGGLMLLVVYSGHMQGKDEKEGVLDYVMTLDQNAYSVLQYGFINQKNNPPFLLAIEKRKHVQTS